MRPASRRRPTMRRRQTLSEMLQSTSVHVLPPPPLCSCSHAATSLACA
jgi:hypothetical protein